MGKRTIAAFAIMACFFACGDIMVYPAPAYAEEELGDVVIQVLDASGQPASGARVYWGDNDAVYEGFETTDSEGRAELGSLHAREGHRYYFFTFLDGYFVERVVENIEAGRMNVIEIRPDSVNRQAISIETFGNGTAYPSIGIHYQVRIGNCSPGDISYVEILSYDEGGELIRAPCDDPAGYGFNFTEYGRGFPWLGYGYETGKLTEGEKEWLLDRSGGLCLGDLQEIGGRCTYPAHQNPMNQRIRDEYRPECPQGRVYHEIQGRMDYVGETALPKNAEKVVIRAVGIDRSGNHKIVDETLFRKPRSNELAAPCWLCAPLMILAIVIWGLCLILGIWSLRILGGNPNGKTG